MVNSREKAIGTRHLGRASQSAPFESLAAPPTNQMEAIAGAAPLHRPMQPENSLFQLGQKITRMLLNSHSLETVLPDLGETMAQTFEADYCLIAVMASNSATLGSLYWYPQTPPMFLDQRLNPGLERLVRSVLLAGGEPLARSDIDLEPTENIQVSDRAELLIRSVLGITTQFQGHGNGAIILMRSHPHDWTVEAQEQLKAAADTLAVAISQVQLQRQVRDGSQYQTLLNHLTRAIRSSTDLDQVLKLAVDGTARALGVDRGFILLIKYTDADSLLKNSSDRTVPKAKVTVACEWPTAERSTSHQADKTLLNESFWLSDCVLCQQTFKNAPQPTIVANKPRFASDTTATVAEIFDPNVMPALLLVPLESKQTVLGFLALQQQQPRLWLKEELELVELVSAQLSIAILQAQMQRQILGLVEERTTQIKSSLAVQAKLYEKTRQQLEQLRRLNQLKDEFIATVSHELKTPLTKMRMAIQNLRRPALSQEKQVQYLDILEQQCSQEINLIQDLLALQQLELNKVPLQLQRVDLKLLVADLVQSFEETWADKAVKLALEVPERSLPLQTDLDSLRRILDELLTNAGKYSAPQTTVHLKIAHQVEQQTPQIVLSVCNIGAGISPADQVQIFDKFRRGQGVTQQAIAGTGLGLALVKSLIQHLNGTISVSSCPSSESGEVWETCFTLTLPQLSS
jgi:signal transduction histidine kinase